MGYEIFYDRRFILLDGKFIPLCQHGSNNCFEYNAQGRLISEKTWSVMNYLFPKRYIFSEEEIRALAEEYEKGSFFKSRYRRFEPGEFKKWFINGMKNAKPLEYYLEYGNRLYIAKHYQNKVERSYPKTSAELFTELSLAVLSDVDWLEIGFDGRDIYLPKRKRKKREKQRYPFYYVLINDKGHYLCRLTRYGYRYAVFTSYYVKKFKKESEALRYMNKYRLDKKWGFEVKRIDEPAML